MNRIFRFLKIKINKPKTRFEKFCITSLIYIECKQEAERGELVLSNPNNTSNE